MIFHDQLFEVQMGLFLECDDLAWSMLLAPDPDCKPACENSIKVPNWANVFWMMLIMNSKMNHDIIDTMGHDILSTPCSSHARRDQDHPLDHPESPWSQRLLSCGEPSKKGYRWIAIFGVHHLTPSIIFG